MFCKPGFDFIHDRLNSLSGNYLEIGIFAGDALAAMARKYPDRKIYGIDPFCEDGYTQHTTGVARGAHMPQQREQAHQNTLGLTGVKIFEMTSAEFANQLTQEQQEHMQIAAVLIDGSHHYADVKIDIELALRLIHKRPGIIIFDDVNVPDVNRAYTEFCLAHPESRGHDLFAQHPGHIIAHEIN